MSNARKLKIGVITSSTPLANYIRSIRGEFGHSFHVSNKGLDQAIPVAQRMQHDGINVILSHKGTSNLLRENLQIPVLSVPYSSLDVITCLNEAAALGKKIFLPSFREKMSGIEIMEDLLNIQLLQGIYYDIATLKNVVHGAQKQGCDVVIGGGLAVHFAHQYGLIGLEINASKEGINAAIENAISVAQFNRKEKERSKRLYGIIEAVSDGIISVDRNGIVMTVNQTAKKLLKIGDISEDDIKKHLPETPFFKVMNQQEPIFDKMERIKGNLFIFNYIPVNLEDEAVGCIATIKDVSHVMQTESEVRRTLAKGLIAKYRLDDLIHESPTMREVVAMAKRFAPTDSTILITGETGTGKEILAQSIHNLSRRRSKPFVSINCAALPDQLLESELFGYEDGAFTGSKKGGKPGHF